MLFSFLFRSTRFYFKTLFHASVTGFMASRSYFTGLSFYRQSRFFSLWYLFYSFYCSSLIYQAALRLKQQIIVTNSLGIEKGDYDFMKAGSYFLSATADVREFTSWIVSLRRRPYLTMFGRFKKSRGLLVNVSSFYGAVVKYSSKKDLACITVRTTSAFGNDYLLSNHLNVDQAAELYLLEFFNLLTQSYAVTATASQQFALICKKRLQSIKKK